MVISCSGDILGLMSGGSSTVDDVIRESPDWTMTCWAAAFPELPVDCSSGIPIVRDRERGTVKLYIIIQVNEKSFDLKEDGIKRRETRPG